MGNLNVSSALVIDPSFPTQWEASWGQALADQQKAGLHAPIIARSIEDAVRYLTSQDLQFGAIFLSPLLPTPGVLNLISLSHQKHTGTALHVLFDPGEGSCPFSPQEISRLAVQGAIERKSSEDFIKRLPMPMLDLAKERGEKKEAETFDPKVTKGDFLPIPIERLAFPAKIFFDLYIRLSEEKFLKIQPAGGTLTTEQLHGYLSKGVTHLYFPNAHHQRCLDYCELLQRTFITNTGLSSAVKVSSTLSRGDSALTLLREQANISENEIQEVTSFTMDVRELITQMDLDKSDDVKAMLQNVAIHEHSMGTTALALMLARPFAVEHEQSAEILGVAAFMHDVGLMKMPPKVQSEDPTKLVGADKVLFNEHPLKGAEFLQKVGGIHPVVIQVVAQHHERRNGSGFPKHLTGQEMQRLAEVVGFSEELARLIHAKKAEMSLKEIMLHMEKRSYNYFSLPILEAFSKVFAPLLEDS